MNYEGENGYLSLLKEVLYFGEDRADRTGVGTRSLFGRQLRFNLSDGFPLLTTKKMELKSISSELLWFLEGSGDERRLAEIRFGKPRDQLTDKRTIWTANLESPYWIDKQQFDGDLGVIYGVNWRHWENQFGEKIDQIAQLVDGIKNNPTSRRHILLSYNPGVADHTALPACHMLAQFYVTNNGSLDCQWYQRSADAFLGLPYNIASYALLTHMLAKIANLAPGKLLFSGGDVHVYKNHFAAVEEQLEREPKHFPILWVDDRGVAPWSLDGFKMEDFILDAYDHHPAIKAPMAV